MSIGSRTRFRVTNPNRLCSASNCTRRRNHTSRFCRLHQRRATLHGHPETLTIPAKVLRPYRRDFAAFLDKHRDAPQVSAAVTFLDQFLSMGLSAGSGAEVRMVQLQLERLKAAGLTGHEALEIVGAVWLLSKDRPATLPDDTRLTHALGRAFLQARPVESRSTYNRKAGKTEKRYVGPNGTTRRLVGEVLRRLGVMFNQAHAAMIADAMRQKQLTMILAQPFTTPSTPSQGNPH